MALPMLAGTFAMNAYNLTDTWFVSRLGTLPLAAMGFTLPVVMLLTFVAGGIGTGVTTLVSHAIGRHDHDDAAGLVTHGMLMILSVTLVISVCGYLTIEPVFRKLGADAETLPLIRQYMSIWYLGAISMSLPHVGNGILISVGDSRMASGLMILGTVLNIILDPIMIFGLLGFPAMGISGAALATVISQAVSMACLMYLLYGRHSLLKFRRYALAEYMASFGRIVKFAVPSILSMVLMPISATVITWLLSRFGNEAVAAAGASGRIEMFAFVVPMALGISLTPFISQNFGAGRIDRIREAYKVAARFAVCYGGFIAVVFFISAPWLAGLFSDDPKVVAVIVSYIRIISFGYGMMEVHRYCGFIFTGLHKPATATVLNFIRVVVLLIPLSCLGARFWGVVGVFWGRLATDIMAGGVGLVWVFYYLRAVKPTADDATPIYEDVNTME